MNNVEYEVLFFFFFFSADSADKIWWGPLYLIMPWDGHGLHRILCRYWCFCFVLSVLKFNNTCLRKISTSLTPQCLSFNNCTFPFSHFSKARYQISPTVQVRVITQQCSHCQNKHRVTPLFSFFSDEQEVWQKLARTELWRTETDKTLDRSGLLPILVWSLRFERSAASLRATLATFAHAHNAEVRMRIWAQSSTQETNWPACRLLQAALAGWTADQLRSASGSGSDPHVRVNTGASTRLLVAVVWYEKWMRRGFALAQLLLSPSLTDWSTALASQCVDRCSEPLNLLTRWPHPTMQFDSTAWDFAA